MSQALLVIDIQNDDFPSGMFPLWNSDAVMENVERVIGKANAKGVPVILIQHIANSKQGLLPFSTQARPVRTSTPRFSPLPQTPR